MVRPGCGARRWADPLALTLVSLCLFLGWVSYERHLRPVPPLVVGEDLSAVQLVDSADRSYNLASGQVITLLAFHSTCGACRAVAPAWRQWLDSNPQVRAIAVSTEPIAAARAFAADFGLRADVMRLNWSRADRSAALFAQGVPWIVVLRPDGRVQAHGHGRNISGVTITGIASEFRSNSSQEN